MAPGKAVTRAAAAISAGLVRVEQLPALGYQQALGAQGSAFVSCGRCIHSLIDDFGRDWHEQLHCYSRNHEKSRACRAACPRLLAG